MPVCVDATTKNSDGNNTDSCREPESTTKQGTPFEQGNGEGSYIGGSYICDKSGVHHRIFIRFKEELFVGGVESFLKAFQALPIFGLIH